MGGIRIRKILGDKYLCKWWKVEECNALRI